MSILLRIVSLALALSQLATSFLSIPPIEAVGRVSENGHWEQIWSDEFEGDALDQTVWGYDVGKDRWGNNELEYYTAGENLSVEDGCLVITAKYDPDSDFKKYTSSRIKTKLRKHFRYGRIEARIQLPKGHGVWPAFWMMGCGSHYLWPYCGEIDIMEAINACYVCYGTIHWGIQDKQNGYELFSDGAKTNNPSPWKWHIYAIEWSEDEIRWYRDDICYHSFPINQSDLTRSVFQEPFYLILNLAIGGWPGEPDDSIFPQSMYVDYVRAYTWEEE